MSTDLAGAAGVTDGAIGPTSAGATEAANLTPAVEPPNPEPAAQAPPKFLRPEFERMPAELKQRPNWVQWVPTWTGSKWTKRPIQISGFGASTTNPKHWSSFEDVRQAYERAIQRGYIELREKGKPIRQIPVGGVGFVFDGRPDEGELVLAGVDFDKVISKGEIAPLAEERIRLLGSYTEQSVSGGGLHVIVKARPLQGSVAYGGVEMYTKGRFFTMTGRAPENSKLVAAPEAFAALADELRAQSRSSRSSKSDPSPGAPSADAGADAWFGKLRPEKQSEVVKYAALHIANNSKLFELTKHGGNYQEYLKLSLAIARSGVPEAEDIFIEAASIAKEAAPEDALRKFFQGCEHAQPSDNRVTVGTLFYLARQCGADFGQWKQVAVTLADFYAYMPMHNYIFAPSREPWPASSVDARLGAIPLFDADGKPLLDDKGKQKRISASVVAGPEPTGRTDDLGTRPAHGDPRPLDIGRRVDRAAPSVAASTFTGRRLSSPATRSRPSAGSIMCTRYLAATPIIS